MPFVSLTRLRIRSWLYLPAFFLDTMRSARQAKAAEGNLSVKFLRDARNTFWTLTGWDSEASMRKFMLAKPHGPVMRKLKVWCDEAAVTHWTQPETALPTWPEAHRRMQLEGRPSKVNHPSSNHAAGHIPAPTTSAKSDVTFK